MPYGIESHVYHFFPNRGNGRLFVFHTGHTRVGSKATMSASTMKMASLAGHTKTVEGRLCRARFDMPYSILTLNRLSMFRAVGKVTLASHGNMFTYLDKPFRFFLEPIAVALNYVQDNTAINVYMTGSSGGGWTRQSTRFGYADRTQLSVAGSFRCT